MPLGEKPKCVRCGTRETPLWHATDAGSLCNSCLEDERNASDNNAIAKKEDEEKQNGQSGKPSRKSTRITRYCKPRPNASLKTITKGKGRRHIFKKQPIKAPSAVATPVTSNFVFYKGSYFQIGDIVSMEDTEGGIYYAQIRGLLTDQYCEKSAAVTWLLPTTSRGLLAEQYSGKSAAVTRLLSTTQSPPPEEGFSPETYIIGPEEDLPRKLECMEFVMHAPSDYYKLKNTPYPPPLTETGNGYIWTSLTNEVSTAKK